MRLDDRLKRLEKKMPDGETKVNLIIRPLIGVGEKEVEINYLKPMRMLDPLDINCVYARGLDEAEDVFTNRALEEHRMKINAGKDHVLMFVASHKMEDDWLINNDKKDEE